VERLRLARLPIGHALTRNRFPNVRAERSGPPAISPARHQLDRTAIAERAIGRQII
jgi:hypothetical protein